MSGQPIQVAFFADAPDSVIAHVIRDLAASGRVLLDVRLLDSTDVLTGVPR